jgi:hypothetical protein
VNWFSESIGTALSQITTPISALHWNSYVTVDDVWTPSLKARRNLAEKF